MDPAFVAKIRSFYDGVKAILADSLVEGQRLGIVAPGDPGRFATFTVGALKELLAGSVSGDTPLAREGDRRHSSLSCGRAICAPRHSPRAQAGGARCQREAPRSPLTGQSVGRREPVRPTGEAQGCTKSLPL